MCNRWGEMVAAVYLAVNISPIGTPPYWISNVYPSPQS